MLAKKGLMTAPAAVAQYVEDVFSTYLYTGNGSTQTITNGIDLSGEGGMVWIKSRSNAYAGPLFDTARGIKYGIVPSSTAAQPSITGGNVDLYAFNSDGFSVGADNNFNVNTNSATFASWTFRKAENFFDVVTYTGNGTTQAINHNLGSTPGCIIIKKTSSASSDGWIVFHRSLTASYRLLLNSTSARSSAQEESWFGNNSTSVAPTSTQFTVGSKSDVNGSGETYVAYLFAHDAGGFGSAGDQSVIKCGSYTGNGSATGPTITLDWEPQWVLIKQSTQSGTRWTVTDNMRGFPASSSGQNILQPHVTAAEVGVAYIQPTSTGFRVVDTDADVNNGGETYIYIAIRRGPMKTPEVGTDVFSPVTRVGTGANATITAGFPVDFVIASERDKNISTYNTFLDRLRGKTALLTSTLTSGEQALTDTIRDFTNTGINVGPDGYGVINGSPGNYINWMFRRAPGFFDVVCYTGTGSATTVTHNLGVAPELIIVKPRDQALGWPVWNSTIYAANADNIMYLNETGGQQQVGTMWNSSSPTSTSFPVGTNARTNGSAKTFVAYLFATLAGVSKVGTYTGNGSSQTINCGFTSGARFVLIKRTDSTGDWVVFDSARGIISGNDPYLELNTTDGEVTDKDAVDTDSTGFVVNETTGPNINTNSATYIYLAIA